MLRIVEITAYIVVGIQLILMIFGNMGKHLIIYCVLFAVFLVMESIVATSVGLRFYDEQGASWIYVICIFLNAGICHHLSEWFYERLSDLYWELRTRR